uniref:Uncharacterized protein n=1 Tax=Anguilla anguilla TaxID=7936 RepID=A0A0E9XR71_ANGAN
MKKDQNHLGKRQRYLEQMLGILLLIFNTLFNIMCIFIMCDISLIYFRYFRYFAFAST